jgi:hypothetical protein
MGGRGSLSPLFMTTGTVRNSVSKSQGYISSHRGVTLNVLLRRFLCNPHGYDGRTGSEFRGAKSGHTNGMSGLGLSGVQHFQGTH